MYTAVRSALATQMTLGLAKNDPGDPKGSLLVIILTLVVLGWFIWVLANWPDSVIFQ